MASKIKVDQIVGSTGSTVTIPTGQTLTIVDGVPVASGGTGLASFTAGDVLYATGSTTLAKLPKGTAEQVLAMNSGATAPDWGSVDLTVLPTITVAKGGTNLSSFTAGDVLYATGSTTLAKLAKGSALDGLRMNAGATAPEWAAAASGGLTTAQTWRLTADSSNQSAAIFTSNWEQVDAPTGFSILGSVMTESSGIFTFPSTGHWLMLFQCQLDDTNGGDAIIRVGAYTTHNNSTYAIAAIGTGVAPNSESGYGGTSFSYIFDVTDTANYKVKFGTVFNPHGKLNGDTDTQYTGVSFLKLADT